MKMKKIITGLLSTAMLCAVGMISAPQQALTAEAGVSYPVQYFRLGMADTDANVNASGSALAPSALNGTNAEKWSVNWVSSGEVHFNHIKSTFQFQNQKQFTII